MLLVNSFVKPLPGIYEVFIINGPNTIITTNINPTSTNFNTIQCAFCEFATCRLLVELDLDFMYRTSTPGTVSYRT